jgi:hypothetical protein
MLNSPVY